MVEETIKELDQAKQREASEKDTDVCITLLLKKKKVEVCWYLGEIKFYFFFFNIYVLIFQGRAPKKADKRNKGSKKANSMRSKSSKKGNMLITGDDLSNKVYQTMEKHKDVFFTVLLNQPSPISSPLPGTSDPDSVITCDLMDGRDAFLTMARERHWEFSSLRRAKYSTMAMLHELHTQGGDKFVYNCNNCRMAVETRYHCRECDVGF